MSNSMVTLAHRILDHCLAVMTSTTADDLDVRNGNPKKSSSSSLRPNDNSIERLPANILLEIFSFVNLSDLLQSRMVCVTWNRCICESQYFLPRFTLRVHLFDESFLILCQSLTPWKSIRLTFIQDSIEIKKVENLFPQFQTCLMGLKSLHISSSLLSWTVVQSLVSWTNFLEELIFRNVVFIPEDSQTSNSIPTPAILELSFQNKLTNLKELRIYDNAGLLHHINWLLTKISGYQMPSLERFHIFHDSSQARNNERTTMNQAVLFHALVLQIMRTHSATLRYLCLNLRNVLLTNTFCDQVLDNFNETMEKLEEFHLTPYMSEEDDVFEIDSHSPSPLISLCNFLRRHNNLKVLSFPHFNNMSSSDLKKRRILRSLSKSIESLLVPGHSYLLPDFLSHFPKMRRIALGSVVGKPFHPNSFRYTPSVCSGIEEISLSSRIHLNPGKLTNFAWKFPSLTKLELNAFRSVVNDFDLQSIVLHCRLLQHLSITGCDLISDFGFTGSSPDWCRETFRLGIIHFNPPEECPPRNNFRPLANLRGLRTLTLKGKADKVTDVGIFYGLRFNELKNIWIPYSDRITGWSLKELARYNPSLEVFGMTAANVDSLKALQEMVTSHSRMSPDSLVIQNWTDSQSTFSSPSILSTLM